MCHYRLLESNRKGWAADLVPLHVVSDSFRLTATDWLRLKETTKGCECWRLWLCLSEYVLLRWQKPICVILTERLCPSRCFFSVSKPVSHSSDRFSLHICVKCWIVCYTVARWLVSVASQQPYVPFSLSTSVSSYSPNTYIKFDWSL